MTEVNVPALVKQLRHKLGLTQEQLAHKIGVAFSTVNQWENGKRQPQPYLVKRLLELAQESLRPRKAARREGTAP